MTTNHRPATHYIDDRLRAGAGVVDAAAALEWRGFQFDGVGWRPAPGCEGYHLYRCDELQASVKRFGPNVWIGSIGPGPVTNSATFEGLCVAAVHGLLTQYRHAERILTKLDAERKAARKRGAK